MYNRRRDRLDPGQCGLMLAAVPRRFECRSDGTYLQVFYVGLEPTGDEPEDTEYTGPVRALSSSIPCIWT